MGKSAAGPRQKVNIFHFAVVSRNTNPQLALQRIGVQCAPARRLWSQTNRPKVNLDLCLVGVFFTLILDGWGVDSIHPLFIVNYSQISKLTRCSLGPLRHP